MWETILLLCMLLLFFISQYFSVILFIHPSQSIKNILYELFWISFRVSKSHTLVNCHASTACWNRLASEKLLRCEPKSWYLINRWLTSSALYEYIYLFSIYQVRSPPRSHVASSWTGELKINRELWGRNIHATQW